MQSSAFTQKALQQYLSERAPFYNEQMRVWCARMQGMFHFDAQACVALFGSSVTISTIEEQPACMLVEQHNDAPYTLRLILSDTSMIQQITTIQVSRAVLDSYMHIVGSLPVNVQWLISGGTEAERGKSVPFSSIQPAHGCLWDGSGSAELEAYGTPCLALGCKGQLGVELYVGDIQAATNPQNNLMRLSPILGTIAPNMAWRLLWAIASLKDAREEILIDSFYDTLIPPDDDEVALLSALPDIRQYLIQHLGMKKTLMDLTGLQLHYTHLLTPTCTVLHVASGEQGKNAIPAQGVAQIDFQLVPGQEPDAIFVKLRRHLDAHGFGDIKARKIYARPAVKTALHHPFVQHLEKATEVAYGKQPAMLPLVGSTTPSYSFQDGMMPTIVFSSGDAQQTDYQHEQRFIMMATQIALLIKYIKEAAGDD